MGLRLRSNASSRPLTENPPRGGSFAFGLRCRARHSPLRGCSACSASLQFKIPRRSAAPIFRQALEPLLAGPELPMASDVAVPWDIAYFIEHLRPQLPPGSADFLTTLVAALNDRAKLPDLERSAEWKKQAPVPLDAPWPD